MSWRITTVISLILILGCSRSSQRMREGADRPSRIPDIERIIITPVGSLQGDSTLTVSDKKIIEAIYAVVPYLNPGESTFPIDYNAMYRLVFMNRIAQDATVEVLYNEHGWTFNGRYYQMKGRLQPILEQIRRTAP